MQEKDMVNDVLSQINSSITGYSNVITQASNPQLRQTIQQMRNNCETFQYELYQMAEQKGFYQPAKQVNQGELQQVKTMFQ